MELTYLGHSCFKLRGKQLTLIIDPFDPDKLGLKLIKQIADVVVMSHGHVDHSFVDAVKPKDHELIELSAPGEYEVKEVRITGWKVFHDDKQGMERGKNTVFKIEMDGVRILHLGDLGHTLPDDLIDELGDVDVLLIPVGGHFTINAAQAGKVVRQVDPKITVPMHYRREGMNPEIASQLAGVESFLTEMGVDKVEAVNKLSLNEGTLPEDMQVVVME